MRGKVMGSSLWFMLIILVFAAPSGATILPYTFSGTLTGPQPFSGSFQYDTLLGDPQNNLSVFNPGSGDITDLNSQMFTVSSSLLRILGQDHPATPSNIWTLTLSFSDTINLSSPLPLTEFIGGLVEYEFKKPGETSLTRLEGFIPKENLALVPEPSTILLFGFGLIGLAGFRKKFGS